MRTKQVVKDISPQIAQNTPSKPVEQKEVISKKGKLTEELKTGSYYMVIDLASNTYMEGELESVEPRQGINIFKFADGSRISDNYPMGLRFIEIKHPNPLPANSILLLPNLNDETNVKKLKELEVGKKYKVIQPQCSINRTATLKTVDWMLGYPFLHFKGIKRHIDVCLGKVALIPKDT